MNRDQIQVSWIVACLSSQVEDEWDNSTQEEKNLSAVKVLVSLPHPPSQRACPDPARYEQGRTES